MTHCCLTVLALLIPSIALAAGAARLSDRPQSEERLSFQTKDPYRPRVHLNADVAMVYGIDKSLPERIKTWRDRGTRSMS